MAVDRNLTAFVRQTPEYRNGLAILGEPEDYATQIMLEFIGFFYVMTIRAEGSIEELDTFLRQMGITPEQAGNSYRFHAEEEEALTAAFTFIVGRNSKEYFEGFLRDRAKILGTEN